MFPGCLQLFQGNAARQRSSMARPRAGRAPKAAALSRESFAPWSWGQQEPGGQRGVSPSLLSILALSFLRRSCNFSPQMGKFFCCSAVPRVRGCSRDVLGSSRSHGAAGAAAPLELGRCAHGVIPVPVNSHKLYWALEEFLLPLVALESPAGCDPRCWHLGSAAGGRETSRNSSGGKCVQCSGARWNSG